MAKRKRRAAAVIIAALLLAAGLLAWRASRPTAYGPDPNAAPAAGARLTPEEMLAQLQAQAEESAFRLRIDARPRVTGATAALLLENPVENTVSLSVTVTLDENGETLYESGTLAPGAQVLAAELQQTLPPGEHLATAAFTAVDPETGEAAGSPADVALTLVVKEPLAADSEVPLP